MRRGWQVTAGVALLLCLFVMWQAWKLALVDRLGPGPGFFPFWLAVIGAALACVIFVQTTREAIVDGDPVFPSEARALLRPAAILGITTIAAIVMQALGFRLTTLLFTVVLVAALGARGWLAIAIFALAASFGVFQVFNNWLDVILPQGLPEQLMVE